MVFFIMVRPVICPKAGNSLGTRRRYATPMAHSNSSVLMVVETGIRALAVVVTSILADHPQQGRTGQFSLALKSRQQQSLVRKTTRRNNIGS